MNDGVSDEHLRRALVAYLNDEHWWVKKPLYVYKNQAYLCMDLPLAGSMWLFVKREKGLFMWGHLPDPLQRVAVRAMAMMGLEDNVPEVPRADGVLVAGPLALVAIRAAFPLPEGG